MKEKEVSMFVNQQLSNILCCEVDISKYVSEALEKSQQCFRNSNNKYYKESNFTVYHTGKYSIFLYYLSNTIYRKESNEDLAGKIYYLNKILHSVDWFYAIELPDYWGVEHPMASVLGRANYGNGFFIYQGCTVGGNKKKYPILGENVVMYSNSSILGDCHLGDNVIVSAGTQIIDEDIPKNSIVFGTSPNLIIKSKVERINQILSDIWITSIN